MRVCDMRPSIGFHNVPQVFLPTISPDIEWKMIDNNEDSLEEDEEVPIKNRKTV